MKFFYITIDFSLPPGSPGPNPTYGSKANYRPKLSDKNVLKITVRESRPKKQKIEELEER
jgi:hypothetical protein